MSTERLIRISIHFRRKKGMSEQEFHDHYANIHGPLVTSWALRRGIVKYVQVRKMNLCRILRFVIQIHAAIPFEIG